MNQVFITGNLGADPKNPIFTEWRPDNHLQSRLPVVKRQNRLDQGGMLQQNRRSRSLI